MAHWVGKKRPISTFCVIPEDKKDKKFTKCEYKKNPVLTQCVEVRKTPY